MGKISERIEKFYPTVDDSLSKMSPPLRRLSIAIAVLNAIWGVIGLLEIASLVLIC